VLTRIPRERPDMPSVVREDWEPAHAAFHMALISASGSPILAELCEKLFVRADRYRRMSVSLPGQSRDVVREHADIMQAAVARDADRAVACLQAHYQATADQVRQLVGPG
jgi:GntR family carbon starvation induced transcriptional regulator